MRICEWPLFAVWVFGERKGEADVVRGAAERCMCRLGGCCSISRGRIKTLRR